MNGEWLRSTQLNILEFLVAIRLRETPVLIPNTMVKLYAAESTALVTVWEDRWLPDHWGRSSVGRAPALQAGGQGFESPHLHLLTLKEVSRVCTLKTEY